MRLSNLAVQKAENVKTTTVSVGESQANILDATSTMDGGKHTVHSSSEMMSTTRPLSY
jgi:hypothetical protein